MVCGIRGYKIIRTTLVAAHKELTFLTPSLSRRAPLWIEKKVARKARAPAITPIWVADIPNSTAHHNGISIWVIGSMPMLMKAVL